MENMNNTMELLAGKVSDLSSDMDTIFTAHNDAVDFCNAHFKAITTDLKMCDKNFKNISADIQKLLGKHNKLGRFVVVAGIGGGYLIYKQFKAHNERMAAMEKELDMLKNRQAGEKVGTTEK